jgi:hypothetical protein
LDKSELAELERLASRLRFDSVEDIETELEELQIIARSIKRMSGQKFSIFDRNKDGMVDLDDVGHALIRYEFVMLSGTAILVLAMCNFWGVTSINPDFFWALAGLTLTIEGAIELYFSRKILQEVRKK